MLIYWNRGVGGLGIFVVRWIGGKPVSESRPGKIPGSQPGWMSGINIVLYNQYPDLDAIFVGNDQMALSVLQFCAEGGQ